ncbi:hypothetical protein MTR_6g089060 [Medicago truncatula]|uniref:Uncharacterized protein n=1 Tax=Medicago truncatula TaxID=3880 RepID=G7KPY7_MEDTR|nr:hypothetical protein MTR_6g089060 [Medicago truncatula]
MVKVDLNEHNEAASAEDTIGSTVLFSPTDDQAHALSVYIKEDSNLKKTTEVRSEPQVEVNGVAKIKHKANWTDSDKKKVQYDLKARNILISTISVNEYQSVSHCKATKAILDALETLLEGTEDVKRSKSIFSSSDMNYSHGGW